MKTHILSILLLAIMATACASKEHPTAAQVDKQQYREELQEQTQYSQIDGPSNRGIR